MRQIRDGGPRSDRAGRRDADSAPPHRGPPPGRRGDVAANPPITTRRPILRFVLLFALFAGAFNLFYYAVFARSRAFERYLAVNASASAAVMHLFGTAATADGGRLQGSTGASLMIAQGCDAIQPASLFFFAVVASPVSWRMKLPAMLAGTALLLALNVVRIVTLFYVQLRVPRFFETMHIDVWQALFIVLALALWVVWARWAVRPRSVPPTDVPA